jgi:hypothetical protein
MIITSILNLINWLDYDLSSMETKQPKQCWNMYQNPKAERLYFLPHAAYKFKWQQIQNGIIPAPK